MTIISKITSYIRGSTWASQRSFDEASERQPTQAHVQGAMFGIIVAALCVACVVVLGRADYRAARSMLEQGVSTAGVVQRVDQRIEPSVGARKYYVTTVAYQFVGPNGVRHRGLSAVKARTPRAISRGDAIEVLHHPARPQDNAWRAALEATVGDARAGVFASLVLLPWLGLMLLRYARWITSRRLRRISCA